MEVTYTCVGVAEANIVPSNTSPDTGRGIVPTATKWIISRRETGGALSGANEQVACAFAFKEWGTRSDLDDSAPSISPVLQDKNGVLEVNGYDSERTENIESNDAVRLPKLEVADHYSLAKRTMPLLQIWLAYSECDRDERRGDTSTRHVDGDLRVHVDFRNDFRTEGGQGSTGVEEQRDAIPVHPSRDKDEAIAGAEMDVVLAGASGRGRLLTRPQPASDSQQAKNCNRRSPDCQVSLPTDESCSG